MNVLSLWGTYKDVFYEGSAEGSIVLGACRSISNIYMLVDVFGALTASLSPGVGWRIGIRLDLSYGVEYVPITVHRVVRGLTSSPST